MRNTLQNAAFSRQSIAAIRRLFFFAFCFATIGCNDSDTAADAGQRFESSDDVWGAEPPSDAILPVSETGETAVPYLAEDAYSQERVAEGEAIFKQKCGTCHAYSGRDMPLFGAGFSPARVVGSVKKFAGAMGDPEAGEKVWEYLRYTFPGPLQGMHDPYLQSGPKGYGPGKLNPVLTDPADFWGAQTGHRAVTIEDIYYDVDNPLYNRTGLISNKRMLSWQEWMPHFIPAASVQPALLSHVRGEGENAGMASLDGVQAGMNLVGDFNADEVLWGQWTLTGRAMGSFAVDQWMRIQAWDQQMPQYLNGEWLGNDDHWNFPLESAAADKPFSPTNFRDGHKDAEGNTLRYSHFLRYRRVWFDLDTGNSPYREINPNKIENQFGFPWGCWLPSYTNHNQSLYQSHKWYKWRWLRFRERAAIDIEVTDDELLEHVKGAAFRWRYIKETLALTGYPETIPHVMYTAYMHWKALAHIEDIPHADDQEECPLCYGEGCEACNYTGFVLTTEMENQREIHDNLEGMMTDREKRFFYSYAQRSFGDVAKTVFPSQSGPVLYVNGPTAAKVGQPLRIYILRAQAEAGGVTVNAANLPGNATFASTPAYIHPDDTDYYIDWTPGTADIGTHDITITAASDYGTDEVIWSVTVSADGPAPTLDPIADKIAYAGQTLTFPITVDNNFKGEVAFSTNIDDWGELTENSTGTAGIFSIDLTDEDVGTHEIVFTATDESGQSSSQTAAIRVLPNTPPTLEVLTQGVGPGSRKNIYFVREGEAFALEMTFSDPDGDDIAFDTNFAFPGTLDGQTWRYTVTADVAEQFPGPNVFTPTVRDDKGAETFAVLLVYFERADAPLNHHPWAMAGDPQNVISGDTVQLDGSLSDDTDAMDIPALTYSWEQNEGPAVTLDDTTSIAPTFTAPDVAEETVLEFFLTVTDPEGATDIGVTRVRVLPEGTGLSVDTE